MPNHIEKLTIKNFKSIRELSLDCERINIFIGKPNAGKSNILEAISLLGMNYAKDRFMDGFVRYNKVYELFNNFDVRNSISVRKNDITLTIRKLGNNGTFHCSIEPNQLIERHLEEDTYGVQVYDEPDKPPYWEGFEDETDFFVKTNYLPEPFTDQASYFDIEPEGKITKSKRYASTPSPVKKYEFRLQNGSTEDFSFFIPPHGGNFYEIVRSHLELREEIQQFLQPNGLELLLDEETRRVAILQREAASVLSLPLRLVPDTFQRYIFHLAAIMSNTDSVLLFEEPESHSYAPYIYELAQHILDDERGNQYFITTHNPYLLTPILQETKDVALFVTWFENYQTCVRRLSEEEVGEVLNYGMDIFLNLKHFLPA